VFLDRLGIPEEDKNDLISTLEDNPFIRLQEELKSYYKIHQHTIKMPTYIAPQEIKLPPNDNGRIFTFQYVSVVDTIKAVLSDPDFKQATASTDGLLRDVIDGSAYKNNKFFQKNPDAVPMCLYSDAFQLSSPLGTGRGKQKVLIVYFTLLNMSKHLRSKKENTYLALAIKDRHLKGNREIVYKPLLEDLKKLESGIDVGGRIVKVGLLCHVGDNLEQHLVGGFSGSFSSKDVCRACHQQYQDLDSISGVPKCSPWTIEEYEDAVKNIQPGETGLFGVSSQCVLNSLEAFSSVDQMPFDKLHDWDEKVGACDALTILKVLIAEGHFTLKAYNSALQALPLSDYEAPDRPPSIQLNNDRIPGKALSVALHIKLMPVLIWRVTRGIIPDTPLLRLLSIIHRVNEYLMADTFSVVDISDFQDLVVEFFHQRKICEDLYDGFVNKTPKFHFLGKELVFFLQFSFVYIFVPFKEKVPPFVYFHY